MSRRSSADLDRREDHRRTRKHSAEPFLVHWKLAGLVLPLIGTVFFLVNDGITSIFGTQALDLPTWWPDDDHKWIFAIGLFNHKLGDLIIGLTMLLTCLVVPSVVVGVGLFVRKRNPVIVGQAAASSILAGLMLWITTTVGWPAWWIVCHAFGSAALAISWNLYRTDAFRGDPRGKDDDKEKAEPKEKPSELDKLFGMPQVTVSQPEIDDHFITAEIDPGPGKTIGHVNAQLEAIEDRIPPAIGGRARLEKNPITKKIKAIFMHNDPLEPWPLWQGPSNPGGSFADGGIAGQYADAKPEKIHFAKFVDSQGRLIPAGHLGTVGTTQAGKSAHGAVLWTDIAFTRCDVNVIYIDCAKPGQSLAGLIMDDIVLFADGYGKAKGLLGALGDFAFKRAERMGAAGHMGWTARTFAELGLCAYLVVIDEADQVCGTNEFRDLVTKCLSAGIYVHTLMPRVDGDSMDTTARTAMNQWLIFGTGDDYSHRFAMTKATASAGGSKVCDWRNSKPGYHFYDAAPAVEETRYAMEIRSMRAEFTELLPHIIAGRAYRAPVHPDDIADLGSAWGRFQPRQSRTAQRRTDREPVAVAPATTATTPPPAQTATPETPAQTPVPPNPTGQEGTVTAPSDMMTDPHADPYDTKDYHRAAPGELPPLPAYDDPQPDDAQRLANSPEKSERPDVEEGSKDDLQWGPTDEEEEELIAPTRQAAYDELDRALIEMFHEGIDTFRLTDVLRRFRFKRSLSWFSTHMARRTGGGQEAYIMPPGFTIEQLPTNEFMFVRDAVVINGTATEAVTQSETSGS